MVASSKHNGIPSFLDNIPIEAIIVEVGSLQHKPSFSKKIFHIFVWRHKHLNSRLENFKTKKKIKLSKTLEMKHIMKYDKFLKKRIREEKKNWNLSTRYYPHT